MRESQVKENNGVYYDGFSTVYIAYGYTDMRCGIDGLCKMIVERFQLDPRTAGTLFLFCGKSKNKIRGLLWTGDGFLLLYKRLDYKYYNQWPMTEAEVLGISGEMLHHFIDELSLKQNGNTASEEAA